VNPEDVVLTWDGDKRMKLLFCPDCHDVHGLVMQEWRKCLCGESGGQYNSDGMTATVGGKARVFGVGNPFFDPLYVYIQDTDLNHGLKKMQKDLYGHNKGDCWWGEYEGDKQIFRIQDAEGPRLRVKVTPLDGSYMNVKVTDKRWFSVAGVNSTQKLSDSIYRGVAVPRNPQVKITRWNNKKKDTADKMDKVLKKNWGKK
jgi:hypothetical protein